MIRTPASPRTFNRDITSWITGPGTYYLDFGGKLMADSSNERGNFSFDNILLEINNYSNTNNSVYFRKNFTISNISIVGKGLVRILSEILLKYILMGSCFQQYRITRNLLVCRHNKSQKIQAGRQHNCRKTVHAGKTPVTI